MNNLQEQLIANLPPGLLDHVTSHSATYWTFYQRFIAFQSAFRNHLLAPLKTYIISPLLASLSTNPDLATVAILLVVLFVSLKILGMLYRTIVWWISLFVRLAFWSAIIMTVAWVWQRGIGGAFTDATAVGRQWNDNYQYWQQRELNAHNARGGGVGGVGGAWWTGR